MRIEGKFTIESMAPASLSDGPELANTGVPIAFASMEKRYTGDVQGRSGTVFGSAFNHETGVGSYVAMESFDGSLGGRTGTFVFVHTATTHGTDRLRDVLSVVPGSGTGELEGIDGGGGMSVDADGEHHIWFDLED